MTCKLTPARAEFLRAASSSDGVRAVDYYPPVKWALSRGYVKATPQRMGGAIYHITAVGKAAHPEVCV